MCVIQFIFGSIMNSLSYYRLRDEPWTETEDLQLRTEYIDQGLDIIQIADLHYKTPGQISYRLKKLGITDNYYKNTRGYDKYITSTLYREIRDAPKAHIQKEEKERKRKRNKSLPMEEIRIEINQLHEEINGLKKDIKEILRLMSAVYDFESQP